MRSVPVDREAARKTVAKIKGVFEANTRDIVEKERRPRRGKKSKPAIVRVEKSRTYCKHELPVIEPYFGPPCKREAWSTRGCVLHGRCVRVKGLSIRSCDSCEDRMPNFGGWRQISRARAAGQSVALKQLADLYVRNNKAYEGSSQDRGIIISGGGKYFASTYVTCRAIRKQDSSVPIEVWYYGDQNEWCPKYDKLLEPYGVKSVDATKLGVETRYLAKYAIKSFAVRYCDFREVLHLDADSYPVGDMNLLWGKYDSVFWHDAEWSEGVYHPELFRVLPVTPNPWETGQFIINREMCWDMLCLAFFYDQYSDYTWTYGLGDTATWRAAWDYFSKSPTFFAERPEWVGNAFLQQGPDGRPLFVHRCRDKFRVDESPFYTHQNTRKNSYDERLPLEKECFEWLEELRGKL